MYEEYAVLTSEIEKLTQKKDILKEEILMDMVQRGTDKESHNLGKFTISMLKKWTYTQKTEDLAEKLKTQKAKEESTGEATFEEKESLRFTPIKL